MNVESIGKQKPLKSLYERNLKSKNSVNQYKWRRNKNVLHFIQFLINNRRFQESYLRDSLYELAFRTLVEFGVMSLAERSLVSKLELRKIMTLE